jgi:hypothetical protein
MPALPCTAHAAVTRLIIIALPLLARPSAQHL